MHSQKIRTKAQRVYLARFMIRCAVFVGVVYLYLFRRDSLDCGSDFFDIFPKWSLTGKLLAVLLCLHQAMYLNHLLAVDYQRSEQEAAVVRTLGTELVRDYGTDKPVVLVGRYTLGENITRYTTADPMQHPLYRFFREHTSWESGDTVKYVETNCNSVLNWSVTAFSEVDDVYGQAAEHLFRYYGFALDMTHSAALHEQAQTYADAHDLPGYPRAGAIVDCGDYVLVNLQ